MLNINEIKLNLDENEEILPTKISQILKVKSSDIKNISIKRKSLDAREVPCFVYSVDFEIKNEDKYLKIKNITKTIRNKLILEKIETPIRPIVVGYGPSGIFATLGLLRQGIKPIVFERGSRIDVRSKEVDKFFKQNELNENSNIQFGEGGAGTFSDAKLTTRSKDLDMQYIVDTLIEFGAKESIRYEHLPHIGTDKIRSIIQRITNYLINEGVEFHFNSKVDEILIENEKVKGVRVDNEKYYSDIVVVALGHSAFDLFKSLHQSKVYLEAKEFAVGVRVEHPKLLIDKNQNKDYYNLLDSASYSLIHKINPAYSVYSFCMCPGGHIVSSGSNKQAICLNGMSYSLRNNKYSNSGILVPVRKQDLKNDDLFAGFEYILNLEKKAYNLSNSYKAPAQNIKDFLNNELNPLKFESSYSNGTFPYNLNNFFSENITNCLKEAFINFDKKIKGFIDEGIMLAPETRSSCPIRIKRNIDYQSVNIENLYPIGEGAGYSGGIMSSALDGLKASIKIKDKIKNKE